MKNSTCEQLNSCWESLLRLAADVRGFKETIKFCSLRFGTNNAVEINSVLGPKKNSNTVVFVLDEKQADISGKDIQACFILKNFIQIIARGTVNLPEQTIRMIKIYAPYCFASLHARQNKKAFTVSHLAQSLDSRIATLSGDSKWIGSPDNLVHAHRMRALCDGVLIGAKTLKKDNPRLTVRHVKGQNPSRIIIGSTIGSLDSLLEASPDPVIFIGDNRNLNDAKVKNIEMSRVNGLIPTSDILHELYRSGIFSVFIEGGSITISQFLKENNIDVLQLHISPMMIGQGLDSFLLSPVEKISDSYKFKTWDFVRQDEGIIFIGTTAQFE